MKIRPIEAGDREGWEPLWVGYLDFYEAPEDKRNIDDTFARLIDPDAEIDGFVALDDDGALLGLTHYFFHADTWQPNGRCYLNDLFTSQEARGRGVGEALIEAVADQARQRGAILYWMTQDFNTTARRLYDRVADVTPFIRYVKPL